MCLGQYFTTNPWEYKPVCTEPYLPPYWKATISHLRDIFETPPSLINAINDTCCRILKWYRRNVIARRAGVFPVVCGVFYLTYRAFPNFTMGGIDEASAPIAHKMRIGNAKAKRELKRAISQLRESGLMNKAVFTQTRDECCIHLTLETLSRFLKPGWYGHILKRVDSVDTMAQTGAWVCLLHDGNVVNDVADTLKCPRKRVEKELERLKNTPSAVFSQLL
jgi:hypothetical protein